MTKPNDEDKENHCTTISKNTVLSPKSLPKPVKTKTVTFKDKDFPVLNSKIPEEKPKKVVCGTPKKILKKDCQKK